MANESDFFSPENSHNSHYKKPENSEIIEALYECHGNVTLTAYKLDVNRRTLSKWIKQYPELAEHKDKSRVQTHDYVASKLMELIEGVLVQKRTKKGEPFVYQMPPNLGAIIFYLKAQAGWSEDPAPDDSESLSYLEQIREITQRARSAYSKKAE